MRGSHHPKVKWSRERRCWVVSWGNRELGRSFKSMAAAETYARRLSSPGLYTSRDETLSAAEKKVLSAVKRLGPKHGGMVPIPDVRKALRAMRYGDVSVALITLDKKRVVRISSPNYPDKISDLSSGVRMETHRGSVWGYFVTITSTP